MRIFVAGGSGTIGVPLVRTLVAAGHQVTALTRTPDKQTSLAQLGATPALADALDRRCAPSRGRSARPTHVIHQLTALPKQGVNRAQRTRADQPPAHRGDEEPADAATNAGARRFIGGSFALLQARPRHSRAVPSADAMRSMESQILEASRAVRSRASCLRYGLFYGPDNPVTQRMIALARRRLLPVVRGDRASCRAFTSRDAVSATVAALDHGRRAALYDIVDDRRSA